MEVGLIAAAAISAFGSFAAQQSANSRASDLQNEGLQLWLQAHIPDPEEQKIALQQYVQQGTLSPAFQQAIQQDPTGFNAVYKNPEYTAAQNKALEELQKIGEEGGLRLQDRAAIQDAMMQSNNQARSNAMGIAASEAQKGLGGSGFEVEAKLANQANAAQNNGINSLKIAGDAQDRALRAIESSGDMATQLQAQDLGIQNNRAAAQDSINRFNTQNLQGVNAANTAAQNYANEYNLGLKQTLSNANTDLENQQEVYNKGLLQQEYNNELAKNAGATGQYNTLGQTAQQGGQNTANTISNIGGATIGALSAQQQNNFWKDYFNSKKNANGGTASQSQ